MDRLSIILLLAVTGLFTIGGSLVEYQNQSNSEKKMQVFKDYTSASVVPANSAQLHEIFKMIDAKLGPQA